MRRHVSATEQSIWDLVEDDKNAKESMVYKSTTRSGAKEDGFGLASFASFLYPVSM
jgi:hypothetical protein